MTSHIRALIVDDEPLARRGVALRLQDQPDIALVGECENGEEAIGAITRLQPDLVFLDVQMPGVDGIEVLRALPKESVRQVVFLTAYEEYALAAFELEAVDYLLKPIDDERFSAALARVRRQLALEEHEALYSRLEKLLALDQERKQEGPVRRFTIRTGNQVAFVHAADIDWIEAVGDYAGLHVGNKTHLIRESLHSLEGRLDRDHFVRVHRSAIIQLDRITKMEALTNKDCLLTLRDGTSLRVSRTYSKSLHDLLRNG